MKTGTKSLLFGCHQFLIHPAFVFVAWARLWGWPSWRMVIAIAIHDWGYWGCEKMDDERGEAHPLWAEDICYRIGYLRRRWWSSPWAKKWFLAGEECAFHSRFLAKKYGKQPSRLCWADKLGTAMYPVWLWVLLASLTGEVREYMDQRKYEIHLGIDAPTDTAWEFFKRYKQMAYQWASNCGNPAAPAGKGE